jgi:hypothetical protein
MPLVPAGRLSQVPESEDSGRRRSIESADGHPSAVPQRTRLGSRCSPRYGACSKQAAIAEYVCFRVCRCRRQAMNEELVGRGGTGEQPARKQDEREASRK